MGWEFSRPAQNHLLSRVKPPSGTKGPFVTSRGFTLDKRPPPYISPFPPPSSNTWSVLDLRRAAAVSPAPIAPPTPPPSPRSVDVPHHPRAPPELRRLHAPAALDDDPARPLTGAPPSFPRATSSSRAAALAFPALCECGRRHFLFSFKILCLCNSVLY